MEGASTHTLSAQSRIALAFHVGTRVAGTVQGSEVLLSSTVKDLVAGSGIRITDRGTHILKGVPGELHVSSRRNQRATERSHNGIISHAKKTERSASRAEPD